MSRRLLLLLLSFFTTSSLMAQVLGNPIYSETFENGLPAGWVNDGASPLARWEYRGPNTTPSNAVCSRGSCGAGTVPLASQTLANGFMIFDSNYWDDNDTQCGGLGTGQDPAPHNAWLTSASINLSGVSSVYLTYQHQLRSYNATVKILVSNNGGNTWNEITSLTQTGTINTPNVQWKTANISTWAANQSNVKIKFQFQGTYYHWSIDDIYLYIPSFNNLEITNAQYTNYNESNAPFTNLMYDIYPTFMSPTVLPNATITNLGTNAQNNVLLNTQVNNLTSGTNIYSQSSSATSVQSGQSINVSTSSININASPADYEVTFQVSQTELDENPSNNVDTLDFSVHPYRLALDEGVTDNIYNVNSIYPNSTTSQIGTLFPIPFNTTKSIHSIEVAIGAGTLPGTVIQGFLYIPTMDSILATTETYTVNLADINQVGESKFITLPLTTPLPINAATLDYPSILLDTITNETMANPYNGIIAAMVRNQNVGQPLYVGRSGRAPEGTTFLHYPQENDLYFLLRIPMVRLKLFNTNTTSGCTDPLAMNYDPAAVHDDESCDYPGCTQEQYDNYDPTANWDDGSCGYEGCMDPIADNYNPNATIMVPCEYTGCTNPDADNYDPTATTDDGSCAFTGCMDTNADNYDPLATADDGNCIYFGCTNPLANNFDPTANQDDGTCIILGCTNINADNYNAAANTDDGTCIISGCTNPNADNYDNEANLDDGSCYIMGCMDPIAFNYNANATIDNGGCLYEGCTDSQASNYDPNADINDGSCIYPGCTDSNADNYDPNANQNDGSCYYMGCMDPDADNYDAQATIDDNSCLYYGCTDPEALNFDTTANFNDGSCVFLTANIFSSDMNGCAPFTINVINQTLVYPESECVFIISTGDTLEGCVSDFNYTFNEPGTYSITYNYYYDGFLSTYTMENIVVYGLPSAPVLSYNTTTGMLHSSGYSAGLSIHWFIDGNPINYSTSNPNFYNQNSNSFYSGNFTTTLTDNSTGCVSESEPLLVVQPQFVILDNTTCMDDLVNVQLFPINLPNTSCSINWGDNTYESISSSATHLYNSSGNFGIGITCNYNGTDGYYAIPVQILPTPAIPIVSYNNGTLTLDNFTPGENLIWQIENINIPNSNNPSFQTFINGNYQNGTYNVIATNSLGCNTTSGNFYVIQPYFNITQSEGCTNEEIVFENNTNMYQSMYCEWSWGDGTFASDFYNSHSYSVDQDYTVTLTCTYGNTNMSFSQPLTIHPTPNTPILSYYIPTAQVTNYDPTNNYQWTYNDNILSNSNTQYQNIYNGTNYNSGWYQVLATNTFNCQSQSNPVYILQPLFAFENDEACGGQNLNLINQSDLSDMTCQVYWGDGSTDLIVQDLMTHTYNITGNYIAAINCYNSNGQGYYTLPYSIYPTPTLPSIAYNAPLVQCLNCNSSLSLDWYLENNLLTETSSELNIVNNEITTNGPYSLTVTNGFGCENQSDTLWIIVPHFVLDNNSGCEGTTLTATPLTDGMDWLSCSINWGDGTTEDIDESSVTHTYNNPYSGPVTVSCAANNNMGFSNQTVNIHPNPNPILIEANNIMMCDNCENGWTIHWTIDSLDYPNFDNLPVVSADLGEWYYITVVDNNGCSGLDSLQTDYVPPVIGLEENAMNFELYPTPAHDFVFWNSQFKADHIEIFDASGNKIWKKEHPNVNEVLNVSMYSSGLYTFVMRVGGETKTARFMITH